MTPQWASCHYGLPSAHPQMNSFEGNGHARKPRNRKMSISWCENISNCMTWSLIESERTLISVVNVQVLGRLKEEKKWVHRERSNLVLDEIGPRCRHVDAFSKDKYWQIKKKLCLNSFTWIFIWVEIYINFTKSLSQINGKHVIEA